MAVLYALPVVAPWMISPSGRVAEMGVAGQGGDNQIDSSTEVKQDTIDKSASGLRDNVVVPKRTKEVERPMSLSDPRSGRIMPDRRPLCGSWKNAINHDACAEG